MDAKLTFNRNDFDEELAFKRAVKACDMAGLLWEIRNNLKKNCERIIESKDEEVSGLTALDIVFDELSDLYYEFDVNIDELYK